MKSIGFCLSMIGLVILSACAAPKRNNSSESENIFVLIPDLSGKTGQIVVKNDAGEQTITTPGAVVEVKDRQTKPQLKGSVTDQKIAAIFKAAMESRPGLSKHYILYFEHDIPELTPSSRRSLPQVTDRILQAAHACPPCDILIVGHADTTGTDEHNLKLGLARARVISKKLAENGIPAERMDIVSHGEKNPFIATPDNVLEPRNRRVEVIIR